MFNLLQGYPTPERLASPSLHFIRNPKPHSKVSNLSRRSPDHIRFRCSCPRYINHQPQFAKQCQLLRMETTHLLDLVGGATYVSWNPWEGSSCWSLVLVTSLSPLCPCVSGNPWTRLEELAWPSLSRERRCWQRWTCSSWKHHHPPPLLAWRASSWVRQDGKELVGDRWGILGFC